MLDMRTLQAQNLRGLSPDALAAAAELMLQHIAEQSKCIQSQAQAIKFKDAKIESITFELARLKAWKFGAKTEAMNAQQRALFEETCAADQASLEAQLAEAEDRVDHLLGHLGHLVDAALGVGLLRGQSRVVLSRDGAGGQQWPVAMQVISG